MRVECEKSSGHHWENIQGFITHRFIAYQLPAEYNRIFKVKRLSTQHFVSNKSDSAARIISIVINFQSIIRLTQYVAKKVINLSMIIKIPFIAYLPDKYLWHLYQ